MITYGIKVDSDTPFPLRLPTEGDYRCKIRLRSSPSSSMKEGITCGVYLYTSHGRRIHFYSDRLLDGAAKGQPFCYEADETVRFYWRHGERTVYYELLKYGDANLLSFWFLHLFLPLFMTFEELSVSFHSGAVEVDGDAIAFIAPSTGGKSTMTDYFLKQGHTLVTDDILPIWRDEEQVLCAGSFPYHRPFRAPETLGYYTDNYGTDFRRLRVLYILEKGDPQSDTKIEELQGYRKFEALKQLGLVYTFRFMVLSHNQILSELLNGVQAFRVTRPWDMERLDDVYRSIRTHTESL